MKNPAEKFSVLGIPVFSAGIGNVSHLFAAKPVDESLLVTFVNPQAFALANQHADFVELLEAFDVVACDSIGMAKAAKTCGLKDINRESFDFTTKKKSG